MKKIITSIFIILSIIVLGNISNAASDFTLKSIDYNVILTETGDMQVTEMWKINVHSLTNTLFKTFTLDKDNYGGISDVKVSEITTGGEKKTFTEKDQEVLHVEKDCYYGLVNSKGKYEIAWGINEKNGDKTYQISYKVENIIKKYNDTAELYWQFIGKDFEVDVDRITGTIIVPNNSTDKTTTRAWAHGPLNGNIEIEAANKVKFDLDYFDAGNYLEVRLAMPPEIFTINTINKDRMDTIISEETKLANQANNIREEIILKNEQSERKMTITKVIMQMISVSLCILFLLKIKKYIEKLETTPKIEPENKCKYYREIPCENATPAEAAFLYYFGKTGIENNLPKVLSSTILNLAMKKYIEVEKVEAKNKKEQIKIKVLEKDDVELKEDEKEIYDLLKEIQDNKDGFNMKELEKYAKKHCETFLEKLEKIPDTVKEQLSQQKILDKEIYKEGQKWLIKSLVYLLPIIHSIVTMTLIERITIGLLLIILSVICLIMCIVISKRYKGLTQEGENQREYWHALKRYMEDYSMIDDREVPELVIWEKYLVFATAFGIADKVLKQLKIQYPELSDETMANTAYLGAMYGNSLNFAIINSINNAVTSAYNTGVSQRATNYNYSNTSSGSGFGGGFSGGGGFGGGGIGRRRPAVEDKNEEK